MMMNNAMMELLLNDKLFDRRSLVFDNGELTEIDDPFDASDLPEGRLGEFAVSRRSLALGLRLFIPLTKMGRTLEDSENITDADVLFQVSSGQRLLRVEKLSHADADEKLAGFGSCGDFAALRDEDGTPMWFGCFDSPEGVPMLGVTRAAGVGEEFTYLLTYAGIGNFTDIRMEADNVYSRLRRGIK